MFETDDFRKQLIEAVESEGSKNNLKTYESSVIDYLQRLASRNEAELMESEKRKAAGVRRRSISDALESARELTREASRYAREDKRDNLRFEDIQKAYDAKFCRVWPFCKG
jgi:hypothetical protein